MKRILIALAGATALTACAPQASEGQVVEASAAETALAEVLAHERRAEDSARDEFRNPAETLAFFELEPSQTIIEYAPGGGWYTRILAPYVADEGSYIAATFPADPAYLGDQFAELVREGTASFAQDQSEALGIPAEKLPAYFTAELPEELAGTVDRVLMIRMMHNLVRWGIADSELEGLHAALKPGGMMGVVQHRAKADASDEFADGNRGYLREADLIALIEGKGFEFIGSTDVNANPNDPTDHENGVWALPPTFAGGDEGREDFAAIGESDRMTLLFKKAE